MKRIIPILLSLMLVLFTAACSAPTNKAGSAKEPAGISSEERQRINLYVAVMKEAFNMENGGSSFIAVDLDTLKDLSSDAKAEVLKELSSLSHNIYDFNKVRNDSTKFKLDDNDNLVCTIDGSLLSIYLESYSSSKAVITGISWFGNLGAIVPEYEAVYKNGKWELELIGLGMS